MIWQVLSCALATAGVILFLWCLVGSFLLPVAGQNLSAVYRAHADASDLEQTVRSFSWLRETGFLDMPLQIVDCGMNEAAALKAQKLAREHSYIQIVQEDEIRNG